MLPIEEITGLAVFFEGDNFKGGLRHFLREGAEAGEPRTDVAHRIAKGLCNVARHYVCVEASTLEAIDLICRRLDPRHPRTMGRRNLDRLEQLDDPANVARLLAFPAEEAARAQRLSNPFRRAKGMERALAVVLLIYTGLRIKNLRHIRLDRDLRRAGDAVMLKIDAAEVKNGKELQFELPDEARAARPVPGRPP